MQFFSTTEKTNRSCGKQNTQTLMETRPHVSCSTQEASAVGHTTSLPHQMLNHDKDMFMERRHPAGKPLCIAHHRGGGGGGGGGDMTPVSCIFVSSPGGKCNHPIRLHPPVGHKVKHSADIGPHCSTAFIFFPPAGCFLCINMSSFLQNISCLFYYICTTLPYLYSVFITKK